MTDDIVTRLREHALEGIWDFTKCAWDIQDGADEIERLRADNQQLAQQLTGLNTLIINMKTMMRQHLRKPSKVTEERVERHLNHDHMGQIMLWVYANQAKSQPRNTDIYADRRGYGD